MAGQPPKYNSPEELQREIDKYFESESIYTITGLALFLGFESRQSLFDYGKREEYSYIIKRAKLKVENGYEMDLRSDKPTGSIFALKNMGWHETAKTDITTNGKDLNSLPIIVNSKGEEPITE
jgi:hypothetical protein